MADDYHGMVAGASSRSCVALHPPSRKVMGGVARLFGIASSLDDAAGRYVRVGMGEVEGGGIYKKGKLAPPPIQAADRAFAAALWARLEEVAEGRAPVAAA